MLESFMVSTVSSDWAALLLRLACGLALMPFAIYKITHYHDKDIIPSVKPFTYRQTVTLALIIENTACWCMILGLCTRLVCIPAICNMIAAYSVDHMSHLRAPADPFLCMFISILICGPGAYSLDYLLF